MASMLSREIYCHLIIDACMLQTRIQSKSLGITIISSNTLTVIFICENPFYENGPIS